MTTGKRDRWRAAKVGRGVALGFATLAAITIFGTRGTQDAVANGDTRTIHIVHQHTKESASITFRRNGYYDQEALKQLNWLLRDWRVDEPTRMEPRLFDIVWEVYREVRAQEPIHVVSAYRSPGTNAMLRRRSRGVAEHSQHTAGRAMDFYLPDVPMGRVREIGMRLQRGGVGFYPNSYNPFVHLDAGNVRSWPRMTSDQLARLFPDGRTVHLPRDGKPLPGYEIAKAEILARGGSVAGLTYAEAGDEGGGRKSLWAMLFGGGDDEDSDFYRSATSRAPATPAARRRVAQAGAVDGGSREDRQIRGSVSAAATSIAAPESAVATAGRGGTPTAPGATETPQPAQTSLWQSLFAQREAPAAPAAAAADPVVAPTVAPTRLASIEAAAILAPTPPRRPEEFSSVLADIPLPPSRPVAVAAEASGAGAPQFAGQMRGGGRPQGITGPVAATDDRAALKALFDAAASPTTPSRRVEVPTTRARVEPFNQALRLDEPGAKLRMDFSSASLDEIRVDRFQGPAVVQLRVIR